MKLSELLELQPHLDMDIEIEAGTLITDGILLLRDVNPETQTDCLGFWGSDGTTGIVQYGLVCSAKLRLERLMWADEDGSG